MFLHNPNGDSLKNFKRVLVISKDGKSQEMTLKSRPGAGKKIIGFFKGIQSREEARALIGSNIYLHQELLSPLENDEWYHHQLLGLKVHTQSGVYLGELVEIAVGESDIWIVEGKEATYYIPYTSEDVCSVSLEEGIIVPDEE